ncbi:MULTISPECIES: hypothetical protein [unclassified Clostridioides]|uniref:hypothetical protein n=1 Tax=unclassified Clostridioides TaxID=2635829 RepID=UPI001D0C6BF3|nr:hypothetical protein [Clostridioides sp. ES-S-0001-02]MCC0651912.1 hypothetical protein [Clostridioides sp. ES-S-0001-03]MCC0671186.1 hypothetical protein [Clostridioides sp. ES-S-0145-01]MCC0678992.1 hypothetical protein [Clostridioides sp. ES-S-0005-03]MCC0694292.1 hypothetical protein [Clostridioides sp. ES-S-0048-02]MCC0703479.1 hypothetical protein [Clostridioides sp. ES-S-0049-02]MCC0708125.1 hypothetical protein [Clostridioides sp. ES-S-0190-01]UDN48804.1 hypothetical protein JJJ25
MLINDKSFYPNNIYPAIDFLKIKRQLKSIYKNDLSDCGSICIIERKEYSISINSIGEINIYYDLEHENKIQSIIDEIEQLFKSQVENFSISKLKN